MKKTYRISPGTGVVRTLLLALLIAGIVSCSNNSASLQTKIDSLQAELKKVTDEKAMIEAHLIRFDSLDFDVYSHAQWDLLGVSHDDNIIVTYPDGHQTTDIKAHIEELKPMFVFAPDTRIVEHPIRFGSGDWTCVTGYILGTFSKPMPVGNGKTIPATGKTFKLPMCTVGHWKNGKMIAENLYWDNQTFMKQIGLAK
ncbi:MAG TPA: ester cyclase [Bacteroidota bacterium]|nr:ester cyclase [Bacteroidota bacterium]